MKYIEEDFKDFPIGEFPYDHEHSALGEYHYIDYPGYKGNFYDPITNHQWRSKDGSWLVVGDGENHFLEQNRGDESTNAFKDVYSLLVHKKYLYEPYVLESRIMPLSILDNVGYAFSYHTSRNYYAFLMNGTKLKLIYRYDDTFETLAETSYDYKSLEFYDVRIEVDLDAKVFLNNKLVLKAKLARIDGKVAFLAKALVRYEGLTIELNKENYLKQINKEKEETLRINNKQNKYPRLKCIKKIDLKNFGSARQLRIARYDGNCYFLLAQHQKRYMRDSFARLSSLTCFDIDGNVLWTKGEPNNNIEFTRISCDLPFQISDINNDGKLEVIYSIDFKVYVCDLLTGKIIEEFKTPIIHNDELVKNEPFYHLNVDALRVADFEGLGYQGDLILKDRYQNVYALDKNRKILFRYHHKNTGHFPYIDDFDSDGKDEMFVGYDLIDHDGKMLFSLPLNSDHTDEIIYTNLKKGGPKYLILASGNEGVNIVDLKGNIVKHNNIGHAQRISVANYDLEKDGYEIVATAFWGSPGITRLYDCDGNLLKEKEFITNGNLVSPVLYDGKHFLFLSNASLEEGGLYDSNLDLVVPFLDDGHPTLTCEVFDVDGDGIDEIICFDEHKMWIYKAENYSLVTEKYERYKENAFSNYRGEYIVLKEENKQ